MFKVAIIGGEQTGDYLKFKKTCKTCLKKKAEEGAIMIYTIGDRYVEAFAERYGIYIHTFPANFDIYGTMALKLRAQSLLRDCDGVIIFDNGTKDSDIIKKMATEKGLPIRIIK